jgi:hypothetical protein
MRLLMPDGYKIAPHTHPKVEHVTVISGTFNLGMGEKFDESAGRAMPAGTFGFWPAGMKHFAWAKGETIIQLHGIGPWTINYLNPADDRDKVITTSRKSAKEILGADAARCVTETELRLIAAPAIIGLRSQPKNG